MSVVFLIIDICVVLQEAILHSHRVIIFTGGIW